MAPFDEEWWDARCLHRGVYDTRESVAPPPDSPASWVRWRLVDELLRRYYVDFGLEPSFALMGVETYQIALASPTCLRAPRYFGRLCGADVHPVERGPSNEPLELLPQPWLENSGNEVLSGGTWASWSEYLQAAIRTLGLETAGVVGHEGCFHRRGKALTPLMYRVGLLLRTNAGLPGAKITPDAMVTVVGGQQFESLPTDLKAVFSRAGWKVPSGPPRLLGVRNAALGWAVLRTDGLVATHSGTFDAAQLWRAGANESEIAQAIVALKAV